MSRNQQQRRGGIGLMLLAGQIMQIGVDRIPPITFATIFLNVVIYMKLWPGCPTVHAACSSNNNVFNKQQWKRLIFSSFFHLDDMHLYYNMISFVWKGMSLERNFGKRRFFIILLVFSILTQLTMLGLNQFLAFLFSNKKYLHVCAAGFSAVIFALKVLTTASSRGTEQIMGLPIVVPSRYACWVELVIIQILVPNTSFTGHLAGILVGLMYVYGPLKYLIKILNRIFQGNYYHQPSHPTSHQPTRPRFQQRSSTGYRQQTEQPMPRSYNEEEEEEIQRAIQESLRQQQRDQGNSPPSYGWFLPENDDIGATRRPYSTQQLHGDRNNKYDDANTRDTNKLYPDLPSRNTFPTPSAPPQEPNELNEPNLPYAPGANWGTPLSYPVDSEIHSRRPLSFKKNEIESNFENESETTKELDVNDVREARLRRFKKK